MAGSERLKITDEAEAFDLDNAVSLRLLKFDNECDEMRAKRIAYEVGVMLGGAAGGGEGSENETVEYV